MNAFNIHQSDRGVELSGEITFYTISELRKQLEPYLRKNFPKRFYFTQIYQFDSAALALITFLLREARKQKQPIEILGVPHKLQDIANLCGVDEVLSTHVDYADEYT